MERTTQESEGARAVAAKQLQEALHEAENARAELARFEAASNHTSALELRLTCAEHYVKTLKEQLVESAVQNRVLEKRSKALEEQVRHMRTYAFQRTNSCRCECSVATTDTVLSVWCAGLGAWVRQVEKLERMEAEVKRLKRHLAVCTAQKDEFKREVDHFRTIRHASLMRLSS